MFEMLFVVVAAACLTGWLISLARAMRGQRLGARRAAARTGWVAAGYLAVVLVVSLATPRRWISLGEEQRFDDWAVTVLRASRFDHRYRVELRVSNLARGRPQRASDAALQLVATDGRTFVPRAPAGQRSLRSELRVGESFETYHEFEVPDDAEILGLDVLHGGWPQWFIIGDRGSLLHRRPLIRLEPLP